MASAVSGMSMINADSYVGRVTIQTQRGDRRFGAGPCRMVSVIDADVLFFQEKRLAVYCVKEGIHTEYAASIQDKAPIVSLVNKIAKDRAAFKDLACTDLEFQDIQNAVRFKEVAVVQIPRDDVDTLASHLKSSDWIVKIPADPQVATLARKVFETVFPS